MYVCGALSSPGDIRGLGYIEFEFDVKFIMVKFRKVMNWFQVSSGEQTFLF